VTATLHTTPITPTALAQPHQSAALVVSTWSSGLTRHMCHHAHASCDLVIAHKHAPSCGCHAACRCLCMTHLLGATITSQHHPARPTLAAAPPLLLGWYHHMQQQRPQAQPSPATGPGCRHHQVGCSWHIPTWRKSGASSRCKHCMRFVAGSKSLFIAVGMTPATAVHQSAV
jgi:hypothetical protein